MSQNNRECNFDNTFVILKREQEKTINYRLYKKLIEQKLTKKYKVEKD